jgi:hypothetical protein
MAPLKSWISLINPMVKQPGDKLKLLCTSDMRISMSPQLKDQDVIKLFQLHHNLEGCESRMDIPCSYMAMIDTPSISGRYLFHVHHPDVIYH